MKKISICIFSFFLLVLLSFCVLSDYPTISGPEGGFQANNGLFNPSRSESCGTAGTQGLSCAVKSPGELETIPLMADVTGNGESEIILMADDTLYIYSPVNLALVDADRPAEFSSIGSRYFAGVYDITGNNQSEILIASSLDEYIVIYNVTAGNLVKVGSIAINESTFTHTRGDIIFDCREKNDCMAFFTQDIDTTSSPISTPAYAMAFNSTHALQTKLVSATPTKPVHGNFFSSIPSVLHGDLDEDGVIEYYLSWLHADGGVGAISGVVSVGINYIIPNNTIIKEMQSKNTNALIYETSASSIADVSYPSTPNIHYFGRWLSGPVILDPNGAGDVLFFCSVTNPQSDRDNMKCYTVNAKTGLNTEVIDFDTSFPIQGLTNPVVGNFRPSSDQEDVCVGVWQNSSVNYYELVCWSDDGFGSDITIHSNNLKDWGIGNYTFQDRTYRNFIQSSEQYQFNDVEFLAQSSENIDEIISSFGTLQIDHTFIDELNLVWENPKHGGVSVMSNNEIGVFLGDYVVATPSNLFYLDDNMENQPASIDLLSTDTSINPCTSSAWAINTSFRVNVKVDDPELDDVSIRVTLYLGTANEQSSGWLPNASSGHVFTIESGSILVNKTISGGTLRIEARDPLYNFDTIDVLDSSFNVASNGVVFDDCTTYFASLVPGGGGGGGDSGASCSTDSDCASGYFCNSSFSCESIELTPVQKQKVKDAIMPPELIDPAYRELFAILILVIIVGGSIFALHAYAHADPKIILYASGSLGFIVYIILAKYDFLPIWILWVILVLAAAFIGFRFTPLGRRGD